MTRPRRSTIALLVALLLVLVAGTRCGRTSKSNKAPGPAAPVPPVEVVSKAPADWDGLTDWQASEWEVVDE